MAGHNTRAVHAGRHLDSQTGAIAPAIQLSSTFARDETGELIGDFLYGRHDNPNRAQLEACLADLEGAAAAMAFGSGCAVAHAIASTLDPGDRLIVSNDMYFGIRKLVRGLAERGHFDLREIDIRDPHALEQAAAGATRRIVAVCESPTNPLLQVVDIALVAAKLHQLGGELVVDNTLATPILQTPLALGADYVMHSTTKYMGGHSDVIGGALLCRRPDTELWQRAHEIRELGGAVPSPFDCWLLLRSIATLGLRVERQADNAARLAELLDAHPSVDAVLYPGLPSHPGHAIAARQMKRPGAMMSLLLAGGDAGAARFVSRLNLIGVATSLGGVHSLAEHRARVEGPGSLTPPELVRLSVGIEDFDDLADDVAKALAPK